MGEGRKLPFCKIPNCLYYPIVLETNCTGVHLRGEQPATNMKRENCSFGRSILLYYIYTRSSLWLEPYTLKNIPVFSHKQTSSLRKSRNVLKLAFIFSKLFLKYQLFQWNFSQIWETIFNDIWLAPCRPEFDSRQGNFLNL